MAEPRPDPSLFEFPPQRPTLRTIALLVKDGGAEALPDAQRRADDAHYQEVTCRSALNPVKGMPFEWTLNPYRGCTHACHYCFARRYQTQLELDSDDEFSSVILVKMNVASVLARELARPAWSRQLVALGTATDPYQPIEGHYQLTRQCLDALVRFRTPVGLVTKGPMVVRDRDRLAELGRVAGCTVYLSVPGIDERGWAALEPGTAHPLQRLRAVRELRAAGVNAGVLMAPIVPGFTDSPQSLDETMRAAADHGAAFVGANVLFLQDGTREHFMRFLSRDFPGLVPEYERLYQRTRAPASYVAPIQAMVRVLQDRYGLAARRRPASEASDSVRNAAAATSVPDQPSFNWTGAR